MNTYAMLDKIKEIYSRGGNIMDFINQGSSRNSLESILVSYDFQAGSYVKAYRENIESNKLYVSQINGIIDELGKFDSILEAGVGEATTFKEVVSNRNIAKDNCYGFDISWSRIKTGNDFLAEEGVGECRLFVGDLLNIPIVDNSIDVVYTSHSIEPNSGMEETILQELYRITRKYLVLFEPGYELASREAQLRMEKLRYVTRLRDAAEKLGYKIIKHELLEHHHNPLNPTAVLLIEKNKEPEARVKETFFQCPITKLELEDRGEAFFCPETFLVYPVIGGIPYLLASHAILACKFDRPITKSK